mmetsp:Transcript_28604/g.37469  ORF Transcript_28604/g.37469 Transcript_28604/m.37469 type:complete len:207 (+) Transcript_28604:258-878(+)
MAPAIRTPANITAVDSLNPISSSREMKAPVQAPVPGKGTPTNKANATSFFPLSPKPSDLLAALFNRGSMSLRKRADLRHPRRPMIGSMLPTTLSQKVLINGKPSQAPTGILPRSSTAGTAEIKSTISSSVNPFARREFAILCPRCNFSPAAPAADATFGPPKTTRAPSTAATSIPPAAEAHTTRRFVDPRASLIRAPKDGRFLSGK